MKKLSPEQRYNQIPHELEGVYKLKEDEYFYPEDDDFADQCISKYSNGIQTGPNEWGIPNIRPDMLVEHLPEKLETFGDKRSTPDDGETTWVVNIGSSVLDNNLTIFDRCIYSFFSNDNILDRWWSETSYRVGQMLNLGVSKVIAPDFSLWDYNPQIISMLSIYKSNWMARFFQETGKIKVIPRLEFFDDRCREFSLTGIPIGSPIIATQFHTTITKDLIEDHKQALRIATKLIECETLLVYASEKGKQLVEEAGLKCNVRILPAVASKRKPKTKKIEDPNLLELKRRSNKKGRTGMVSPD